MTNIIKDNELTFEDRMKIKHRAIKYRFRRAFVKCRFGCENGLIKLENEESVECPDCYRFKYRQDGIDNGLDHYKKLFPLQDRRKIYGGYYHTRHTQKKTDWIGTLLWMAAILLAICILIKVGGP